MLYYNIYYIYYIFNIQVIFYDSHHSGLGHCFLQAILGQTLKIRPHESRFCLKLSLDDSLCWCFSCGPWSTSWTVRFYDVICVQALPITGNDGFILREGCHQGRFESGFWSYRDSKLAGPFVVFSLIKYCKFRMDHLLSSQWNSIPDKMYEQYIW